MHIVDFHTHILPGIDDGARDEDMAEELFIQAEKQEIDIMVATPHFYAENMSIESFLKNRLKAIEKVQKTAARHGIRIIPGAEVAFFDGMSREKEINLLRIRGTNLMLIEMPFRAWTDWDLRELDLLKVRGIQPVIAHLERYFELQEDTAVIVKLLQKQLYIQINADALDHMGLRKKVLELFETGNAHILGSDCHHPKRRPENLLDGRKKLEKKVGPEGMQELDRFVNQILNLEEEDTKV